MCVYWAHRHIYFKNKRVLFLWTSPLFQHNLLILSKSSISTESCLIRLPLYACFMYVWPVCPCVSDHVSICLPITPICLFVWPCVCLFVYMSACLVAPAVWLQLGAHRFLPAAINVKPFTSRRQRPRDRHLLGCSWEPRAPSYCKTHSHNPTPRTLSYLRWLLHASICRHNRSHASSSALPIRNKSHKNISDESVHSLETDVVELLMWM